MTSNLIKKQQVETKTHDINSLGAELTAAPNTGVAFVCCPKMGAALGLAPKVGAWEAVAGKGDPKDEPNAGVWFVPKPPEGAELNTNGEGAADGAVSKKKKTTTYT